MPPQHGAWAFLGLPLVCGAAVSPWSPLLLALAVTWVVAYPVSYFVLALVKDAASRHPHPERLRTPLLVWTIAAVPTTVLLIVARPWLLWIALVYHATFGVNIAFARRRAGKTEQRDGANEADPMQALGRHSELRRQNRHNARQNDRKVYGFAAAFATA